jgi:hypothetical protein
VADPGIGGGERSENKLGEEKIETEDRINARVWWKDTLYSLKELESCRAL